MKEKVALNYVGMENGVQCVMTLGMMWMLE